MLASRVYFYGLREKSNARLSKAGLKLKIPKLIIGPFKEFRRGERASC